MSSSRSSASASWGWRLPARRSGQGFPGGQGGQGGVPPGPWGDLGRGWKSGTWNDGEMIVIPLESTNIAENDGSWQKDRGNNRKLICKWVIFHGYVELPEGKSLVNHVMGMSYIIVAVNVNKKHSVNVQFDYCVIIFFWIWTILGQIHVVGCFYGSLNLLFEGQDHGFLPSVP